MLVFQPVKCVMVNGYGMVLGQMRSAWQQLLYHTVNIYFLLSCLPLPLSLPSQFFSFPLPLFQVFLSLFSISLTLPLFSLSCGLCHPSLCTVCCSALGSFRPKTTNNCNFSKNSPARSLSVCLYHLPLPPIFLYASLCLSHTSTVQCCGADVERGLSIENAVVRCLC